MGRWLTSRSSRLHLAVSEETRWSWRIPSDGLSGRLEQSTRRRPNVASCRRAARESGAYLYFVDPANPNAPGSDWQFVENILLEHPTEGDIVLDILTDRGVGGVEFLSRV